MTNLDQRKGRSVRGGKPAMRPVASEPAGMERDSHGHAIPLKERTGEDRAKAARAKKRRKTSKG